LGSNGFACYVDDLGTRYHGKICTRTVRDNIAACIIFIVVNGVSQASHGQLLRFGRCCRCCLEFVDLGSLFLGDFPRLFNLAAQERDVGAGLVEVTSAARIARVEFAQRNGKSARAMRVTGSRELRAVGRRMEQVLCV
jgi:hypothetical protein